VTFSRNLKKKRIGKKEGEGKLLKEAEGRAGKRTGLGGSRQIRVVSSVRGQFGR